MERSVTAMFDSRRALDAAVADLRGSSVAAALQLDVNDPTGAVTHSQRVLTVTAPDAATLAAAAAIVRRHAPVSMDAGASAAAQPLESADDARYDTYAPAYLYGVDLATHEQHGGREWADAETDLRREWQGRHPDSVWTQLRHAVRRGFERLRRG